MIGQDCSTSDDCDPTMCYIGIIANPPICVNGKCDCDVSKTLQNNRLNRKVTL